MLETIEFFSSLSHAEIQEVARIAKRAEYKRGEIITQQGDVSRDLFIIESGLVEISTKSVLQETKILATLKNGDIFGEMALFDPNSVRSATARALQNSILIVIPGAEFEKLLKSKPTISFKLLGTLSKRLKEANQRSISKSPTPSAGPARIITVASPRNGVGKTTFAVTLAQILDQEVGARTLFIDLDLPFADGTFALGVHSVHTITEFVQVARGEFPDFESLKKHLAHVGPNLYCLPGPTNIIDGEKIDSTSLVASIRILQRFFEYIVIDTDSHIDECFLAALDLSDRIFFIIDAQSPYGIKSSSRYFFGLHKLNLAENRISVLLSRAAQQNDLKAISNLIHLPVVGQLPIIQEHQIQFGRGMLPSQSAHPFCHIIRQLLQACFQVEFRSSQHQSFLSRLFSGGSIPTMATMSNQASQSSSATASNAGTQVGFRDPNFRALLRYIRTGLIAGQIEEARRAVLQLVEMSGTSAAVFQLYGEILMQEGRNSEAIEAFHKAAQLDPDCHMALGYAAILSLDNSLFQKATDLLRKKIEQHPTWPDLRRDLGELYLRYDRPADAIPHLQEAIRINSRYDDAHMRLAEAYYHLGRSTEAIAELQAMIHKNAPAYYLMGKCFQLIDRFIEALEAFRIVQRICPDYRDTNQRIDDLQNYFAKLNGLINIHQKIRREHPSYLDVRLKLAQLLSMAGRRTEAEIEYKEVLAIKPDFQPAKDALDRLRHSPIYEIETNLNSTAPNSPCRGALIELHLGDQISEPTVQQRLAKHILSFKNIRNGKIWEFRIPTSFQPNITFNATSLCPITENDVIAIKLINPQTDEVLFSDTYLVDSQNDTNCAIKIDLSESIKRVIDKIPIIPPVRVFLVAVPTEGIPQKLHHPILLNPRNNVRAEGRIDPDRPDQYCFVLSNGDDDVVKIGDLLELHTSPVIGKDSLVFQIRIGPDDIVAFSRILTPAEVTAMISNEIPLRRPNFTSKPSSTNSPLATITDKQESQPSNPPEAFSTSTTSIHPPFSKSNTQPHQKGAFDTKIHPITDTHQTMPASSTRFSYSNPDPRSEINPSLCPQQTQTPKPLSSSSQGGGSPQKSGQQIHNSNPTSEPTAAPNPSPPSTHITKQTCTTNSSQNQHHISKTPSISTTSKTPDNSEHPIPETFPKPKA